MAEARRGVQVCGAAAVVLAAFPALAAEGRLPTQVRLPNAVARLAVESALDAAFSRLADPACQAVVADFEDRAGHSLAQALAAAQVSAPGFLSSLFFFEGSGYRVCKSRDVLAFTRPGSRVVFVCSASFEKADPSEAWATVVHEMLHALGLDHEAGGRISRTVLQRCQPR